MDNTGLSDQTRFLSFQYRGLEEELINSLSIIPTNQTNIKTYSLFFADFIQKVCPVFEKICELLFTIKYSSFKKTTKTPHFMPRFSSFCENKLEAIKYVDNNQNVRRSFRFCSLTVFCRTSNLLSEDVTLRPFLSKDKELDSQKCPAWWDFYNSMKHGPFSIEEVKLFATYENSLNALAATFVALNMLMLTEKKFSESAGSDFFDILFENGAETIGLRKCYSFVGVSYSEPLGVYPVQTFRYPVESKLFSETFYWESNTI